MVQNKIRRGWTDVTLTKTLDAETQCIKKPCNVSDAAPARVYIETTFDFIPYLSPNARFIV